MSMQAIGPTNKNMLLQRLYGGSSREQYDQAIALLQPLLQARSPYRGAMQEALAELRQAAQTLNVLMQARSMSALCARCASAPGGGCCSAAMAANADVPLLLMNMLAGVEANVLAPIAKEEDACCFLGDGGCLFMVKPIFCLHYNCHHIIAWLSAEQLSELYAASNQVLSSQIRLERILLDWLGASGE